MFKSIRRLIRNFFGFSHGEAKGFLLLLWLLLALSLGYVLYRNLPEEGYTSYAEDKALLDSLIQQMEQQEPEALPRLAHSAALEERLAPEFFPFDPNQLSVDSLRLLGLPQWLAGRIEKYREKGGRFRKKEDLRKIYGLSDSIYAQLAPYIYIRNQPAVAAKPERAQLEKVPSERSPSSAAGAVAKSPLLRLDINMADSLELQQVKGVGPVLSGRIVRFREKLGGFVSLEQLYEVWGLDSVVVERLQTQAYVQEDFKPAIIKINSASREELALHPYINPSQARLLHAYRQQHGPFKSPDELAKIHTLDSEFVKKVAPYIRLD